MKRRKSKENLESVLPWSPVNPRSKAKNFHGFSLGSEVFALSVKWRKSNCALDKKKLTFAYVWANTLYYFLIKIFELNFFGATYRVTFRGFLYFLRKRLPVLFFKSAYQTCNYEYEYMSMKLLSRQHIVSKVLGIHKPADSPFQNSTSSCTLLQIAFCNLIDF